MTSKPKDGDVVIYFVVAYAARGIDQHRFTFIADKTHETVTGDTCRSGAHWTREWRCEERTFPSLTHGSEQGGWKSIPVSAWRTTGRALESSVGPKMLAQEEEGRKRYATFDEAKAELLRCVQDRIEKAHEAIRRDTERLAEFVELREVP